MKTMILTTLMMLTVSTVQAAKHCESKEMLRVLSSAADEIENEIKNDMREVVDRSKTEYAQLNAIGAVTIPGLPGHGTGFLISPCHVLTNAHVAYENPLEAKKGAHVQFSVGQTSNKKQQFSELLVDGKVIAHGTITGEYNKKTRKFTMYKESANSDWAVIKLSKSIAKKDGEKEGKIGYLPFVQMPVENLGKQAVQTAGFPGDRTKNGKDLSEIYADKGCKIFGFSASGYALHTCQTAPGQSGSPLLAMHNGNYYAVGMVSGGNSFNMNRTTNPDLANIAVKFSSGKDINVLTSGDEIVEAVKVDKCE